MSGVRVLVSVIIGVRFTFLSFLLLRWRRVNFLIVVSHFVFLLNDVVLIVINIVLCDSVYIRFS